MRKMKISRNGVGRLQTVVVVTVKEGNQPEIGEHVMLRMTGDCCHDFRPHEYVVSRVNPRQGYNSNRIDVTLTRF